ncbi:hypothetical protein SBOR_1284 [Sclerotinia borealis F-4128]|uniref:DUF3074 domain-containing protein n=1 Tax=Sclerotinia borealis (strain F-4128) TaxID=1432307 RepID=W9CR41_SCLBF|nr:hypothetical protein SBOR_1284 [Sclerotinia borealis F-4128]
MASSAIPDRAPNPKPLGPKVRLRGLHLGSLPLGSLDVGPNHEGQPGRSDDGSQYREALREFITEVLRESIPFVDGVQPKLASTSTWKDSGSKRCASSEGNIGLYKRVVSKQELDRVDRLGGTEAKEKSETWYARRSRHRDLSFPGTATWGEFTRHFKEEHFRTEELWCKSVVSARRIKYWETTDLNVEIGGDLWNNISMDIVEMKHRIKPKPLMKDRKFPVILIAASLNDEREFIVISIPLNGFTSAEYKADEKSVGAAYASIERLRVLPSGEIEWIMATVSDAKGSIPQWIQKLAVPSVISKDVNMYMTWIAKERSGIPNEEQSPQNKISPHPSSQVVGRQSKLRQRWGKFKEMFAS